MLKIVYPVCCGMDVHKSFVYACIASTNAQGVTSFKSKRFSTFTKDLRFCATWLVENNCKDICMESTGKYWIPIYNILESTCKIVRAHPKYVKAIQGKKTDKKDAKWIADIFKHDLVSGSFIPPTDIRQLRDLVRYRWKLTDFNVGEKNRAQNRLTVSNPKSRALSILIYLIDRSNQDLICFPAIPTMAEQVHISVSTVKRASNELMDAGYIQMESRFRENNLGHEDTIKPVVPQSAPARKVEYITFENLKPQPQEQAKPVAETPKAVPSVQKRAACTPFFYPYLPS